MKKVELLSPAGNFECLKQAINYGADAVYLGGTLFSARAFANNFNDEEMIEAINYAHLRNVKVYITLNTLLNEFEIDNAYNKAKFYYEHNVDALIIQDLGLFYRLRQDFPDFELHASTQMHIHNLQGVKNAKELGFKRVIAARESSLKQINEFCKEDIEIECFVHGAICVSYSGQCLMSSVTKNRSANKGMCAQCCRLKYSLFENDKKVNTNTEYLLSPKDMCLLEDIPKLIEAGVSSFKIEGRMKSPAYVGYVTKCYREAIDAYYANKSYKLTTEILNNLKLLYNRGFTNTYLINSNDDLFGNKRPNHMGIQIGNVIKTIDNKAYIKLNRTINQFDGIRIISNNDEGLILNYLKVNNKLVSIAYPNEIIEINIQNKVKEGDIVVKTLDHELEENVISRDDKLIELNLSFIIKPNENITINASGDNFKYEYISSIKPQSALKRPITEGNIIDCFNKVDYHPYAVNFNNIDLVNSFIPLKILNEIRREFYDALDLYRLNSFKRTTYNKLELKEIKGFKQNCIINESDSTINPVINVDSKYLNGFISEFGGLLIQGDKDAYYTLNISNSYAFEFLLKLGFKNIILSTELTDEMINKLTDNFKSRLCLDIKPYILTKGCRTLMFLNRNPFKAYTINHRNLCISDGYNSYDVINNNGIIEIIEDNQMVRNKLNDTLQYLK